MMRLLWNEENHQSELEIIPMKELEAMARDHSSEESWKFLEEYLSNIHKCPWA